MKIIWTKNCLDSLDLSKESKENILQGIADMRQGKVYSSEEALSYIRNKGRK